MFPETSRYHETETATMVLPDGREVRYLLRRFVPQPSGRIKVMVHGGKRLDLVSHEQLRDPKQFWRLCDFNRTLDPLELERKDVHVKIPHTTGPGSLP